MSKRRRGGDKESGEWRVAEAGVFDDGGLSEDDDDGDGVCDLNDSGIWRRPINSVVGDMGELGPPPVLWRYSVVMRDGTRPLIGEAAEEGDAEDGEEEEEEEGRPRCEPPPIPSAAAMAWACDEEEEEGNDEVDDGDDDDVPSAAAIASMSVSSIPFVLGDLMRAPSANSLRRFTLALCPAPPDLLVEV